MSAISTTIIIIEIEMKFFWFEGSVDLEELIFAFKELGIDIDKAEATKLLER